MKFTPKESKNFNEVALSFIEEGKFEEAKKVLEKAQISNSSLLKNSNQYSAKLLDFLGYKNVNLHDFLPKLTSKELSQSILSLKKQGVDLTQKDENGQSLVQLVIKSHPVKKEMNLILKSLGAELIEEDFKKNATSTFFNEMLDMVKKSYHYQENEYFDTIDFKKPEIKNSQGFYNVFKQNSQIVTFFYNDYQDKNVEIFKSITGQDSLEYKEIMTSVLLHALKNNNFEGWNTKEARKLVKEQGLFINENLLPNIEDRQKFVDNCYRVLINTPEILSQMIEKDLITINELNEVGEKSNNIYSRHLNYVLDSIDFREKENRDILSQYKKLPEKLHMTLEKMNVLENLGIKPVIFDDKKKEKLKNKLETILERFEDRLDYDEGLNNFKRGNVDREVDKLSYELHMPPFVVEKLIDFFDKRYGHPMNPEKAKINEEKDFYKNETKKIFNDFLDKIDFVNEPFVKQVLDNNTTSKPKM